MLRDSFESMTPQFDQKQVNETHRHILVFPMKIARCGIDIELQTLSQLFAKMICLKSIHFILILSPNRSISDWDVVFQELYKLEYLDCLSFTLYNIFPWFENLAGFPTFTSPYGHVYVPVVNFNTVRLEGKNLSKPVGLSDFKCLLNHIYENSLTAHL